jgi:hypothetical protein
VPPSPFATAGIVLSLASAASAGELVVHAVGAARGLRVEAPVPWIEGGFGRLGEGGDASSFQNAGRAEAHLGLEWSPAATFLVSLHGTARSEPGAAGGSRVGLVEGFVQYRPELRPDLALRLRAGLFFPPTSLENVDPLWQSPYTLTLSAVNSWIGEEVRLGGLDAAIVHGSPGRGRLELAASVFGGNDAAGALLAWRGWAFGPRLAVVGEVLPLPPLPALEPGAAFGRQRDDGTRPIEELDGRAGWHARARWTRPGRIRLQAAWTDNRGDRGLHRGQYAWATRWGTAGAQLDLWRFRFVGEGVVGDTGMGPHDAGVDVRFRAVYALATLADGPGRVRVSARYDAFRNTDRDGRNEPDGESGHAFTVAALVSPRRWLRLGVEYVALRSDRPAAAFSGGDLRNDARRAQAELRVVF